MSPNPSPRKMMFSPFLGACLLAVLPSQALVLPTALASTDNTTLAWFHPDPYSLEMCEAKSYTQVSTGSGALTADCQALRETVNVTHGYWYMNTTSSDFKFTLNTTNTCTVVVKNPAVSDDGNTYIGNVDVVNILDHVLAEANDTMEWTGSWQCPGHTHPQFKIKNPASSDSEPAAPAATFVSSPAVSEARDIQQTTRRDDSDETAPFAPGDVPYTVCGPSTYEDITNEQTSPHWYDCDPIWGFTLHNKGEWVLGTGSDDWWHLQNASTAKCEFVVQHSDGRPPVGNQDVAVILQYIQSEKDRAKGQVAEYKGTFSCGENNTTVNWWMRGQR